MTTKEMTGKERAAETVCKFYGEKRHLIIDDIREAFLLGFQTAKDVSRNMARDLERDIAELGEEHDEDHIE